MNIAALVKDVLQTMFRFFPFPTRTGLRIIGDPGPESPVLLTCNFDLTVRRVLKALRGLDCYLLVAQSRGINVWCAAGGGHLNAYSVTSVLKTSGIDDRVDHRLLILPQLSAPGIDVVRVEQETGWRCAFGPVYAKDIPAYLAARRQKSRRMRLARFELGERLEMAVMWAAPLSLLAGIPLALVDAHWLPGTLALIWAFTLFVYSLYQPIMRHVPGQTGLLKTMLLGMVGAGAILVYGLGIAGWGAATMAAWCLATVAAAVILGIDLDGTSPLRTAATIDYWGRRWPRTLRMMEKLGMHLEAPFSLRVDEELCQGCATCVDVCPTDVFQLLQRGGGMRAQAIRPEHCEQCTACVKQCPSGAVLADPEIRTFQG